MRYRLLCVFCLLVIFQTASAQIKTVKYVAANGGSIKMSSTYSSISVIGEMAVGRFSSSTFSGTIGYLDEDDALFPTSVKTTSQILGDVVIFPNPNKGAFTLGIVSQKNVEVRLSLVDMLGKFGQQKVAQLNTGQNRILYTGVPNGIWLLRIETDDESVSKRFIVQ